MSLLGTAAIAMWWDMAPEVRPDFEDWHAHEHFPERLAIPGFLRGSRWHAASGGAGVFVMYELAAHEIVSSPPYLARLNAPTPWSTRLMPEHRNMIRSQCEVLESAGGVTARHALTIRLSPAAGKDAALRAALKPLFASLAGRPGLVGAHLLRHRAPALAPTTEQKIRGNDRVADWVVVACGYELAALEALAAKELASPALESLGAQPAAGSGIYSLAYAATPAEVQPQR